MKRQNYYAAVTCKIVVHVTKVVLIVLPLNVQVCFSYVLIVSKISL